MKNPSQDLHVIAKVLKPADNPVLGVFQLRSHQSLNYLSRAKHGVSYSLTYFHE